MELNLKGKTALITGGGHGIGLAIKQALEKEGVNCISWSKEEGIDLMAKNVKIKVPSVDILINNVGGMGTCSFDEAWDCLEKNYGITYEMTQAFIQYYNQENKSYGRVICISSIYGKEKGPNPFFTAAKSAQIAYMKSMAGKHKGITFNTICPGHINVGKEFPDNPEIIGQPEDVANLVVFLCSDLAKHINGAVITIDGGESHSF